MSITICLSAATLSYPQGGGHLWVYLNWALGLQGLGCQVVWLEEVEPHIPPPEAQALTVTLKSRLERYGLGTAVALFSATGERLSPEVTVGCLDLDAAAEADLFLNLNYGLPPAIVGRFRRSALIDIDPGLLQYWVSSGHFELAPHDTYFTIGETVGQPGSRVPETGLKWQYTPPCVALSWWPVCQAPADAPFTTVSHWTYGDEWVEDAEGLYENDKRSGFLPFLDLPRHSRQPLELALCLAEEEEEERATLLQHGWRVRHAHTVTSTPGDYQRYIQQSRGEFSCVKPSCVRLANAWISDRTLCYLASGKPAVIQHTGASRFLPDAAGLFRFRDVAEATRCLETVAADYEHQCRLARVLAEEFFNAKKVARRVLERALT
jgi:hypothetical protein